MDVVTDCIRIFVAVAAVCYLGRIEKRLAALESLEVDDDDDDDDEGEEWKRSLDDEE